MPDRLRPKKWLLPLGVTLAAALLMTALPVDAWADNPSQGAYGGGSESSSLGDVFCNLYQNTKPFGYIFQWAAYVMGVAFVIHGIMLLRGHFENPQNKLSTALMHLVGATMLLCVPSVVDTLITTLYGTPGAGGSMSCSAGSSGGSASTPDVMLTNMVNNIKEPLITFTSIIAIVCGLFMIIRGMHKASKYGFDPKANSVNAILTNIVFGGLLLTIGDNLRMMTGTVFGTESVAGSSAISWSGFNALAGGSSTQFQTAVIAALTFVQIIGVIAFVRGWLILKKSVEGGGNPPFAQGVTHILGGVAAINIFAMLKILDNTFGLGFL